MSRTIDFGIDLGTTNSSIAVCRRGQVQVFQSMDLMNVTPSVVYISKTGRMLVGKKAYDTWTQDPQNTQAEFKRWMGFSDTLEFPASGRRLSAEELSAEVLKAVRADAERQTQEQVTAAVITVPAAFGSLQCEATARAAKMAGLVEAPLLQEPIAAAIAYGASPDSRNQRWMVFDLGGGTLDIAIVSTRNGRLAVLEHQGNNRLGGKDVDRVIAERFLLAPLAASFRLPDPKENQKQYDRLIRNLVRQAEQAKIALSTAEQVTVDLFDLGEDLDGNPIELSLALKRAEIESAMQPLIEQCLALVKRALEGARLGGKDLDRVLLVGGPTQMPILRSAISSELGAALDHSLDPMTVVARGAALYASTIELAAPPPVAASPTASKAVPIELAFERASGTAQSPVAGTIVAGSPVREVKIDAAGGVWTSGWLPVEDGTFHTEVTLQTATPVTHFTLTARDSAGRAIAVAPAEFSIAYMLPMSAAPLPHTIAIELSTTHGVTKFDPVFPRHTPLPAEARKTYRADRTLRSSDLDSTLPIKFWEIEVSEDPQEKWWAGCVHIRADQIKRPIVEGTDIELTIKIDASRRISVDLFVPLLNQSFNDDVYVPDPPSVRSKLQQELDLCFERISHLMGQVYETDRAEYTERVEALQEEAERIAEQIGAAATGRGPDDPDAALRPTQELRKLRVRIAQLEEQLGVGSLAPALLRKLRRRVPFIAQLTEAYGSQSAKREFEKLEGQYQRYLETNDTRGLKWVYEQLGLLGGVLVEDQESYWHDQLAILKHPGQRFVNQDEARKAIADADRALASKDLPGLRSACRRAWELQAKDELESAQEQASQSGLRAT